MATSKHTLPRKMPARRARGVSKRAQSNTSSSCGVEPESRKLTDCGVSDRTGRNAAYPPFPWTLPLGIRRGGHCVLTMLVVVVAATAAVPFLFFVSDLCVG